MKLFGRSSTHRSKRCLSLLNGAARFSLAALGFFGTACGFVGPESSAEQNAIELAIIDGTEAPELTGIVHIEHPLYSRFTCTGTVIAPTLVVTAKHCVFRQLEDAADEPLPEAGFRVGFGADLENLEFREVKERIWFGTPGELEVAASAQAGQDVAILTLAASVPSGTQIHPVDFNFHPYAGDQYTLAGYGLSSKTEAISGTKRSAREQASAFDSGTGILESTGNGACAGDSGGPFLFGKNLTLVGVISQVGGSTEEAYCNVGKSYASGVGNAQVKGLIESAFGSLPPCESRQEVCANNQDENCNGQIDEGCTPPSSAGEGGRTSAPSEQGGARALAPTGGSWPAPGMASGGMPSESSALGGAGPAGEGVPPSLTARALSDPRITAPNSVTGDNSDCGCHAAGSRSDLTQTGFCCALALGVGLQRRRNNPPSIGTRVYGWLSAMTRIRFRANTRPRARAPKPPQLI